MPSPVKRRLALWIAAASSAVAGMCAWLILIRGERIIAHDAILIGGWIALVGVLMLIALLLKTTPTDAIRLSTRTSQAIILGATVLLHGCAIAMLYPALSEDVLRYRFDGKT